MFEKAIFRGVLQSACRTLPIYSGTGRIANSRLFSALAGEELTEVRISDGSTVIVDPKDTLGRTILYFGDQDRKISAVLRSVLREGDIMVDVGANIGALSILAAGIVGPAGGVISVEPQPDLVERISASCSLNSLSNVTVHQIALSDADTGNNSGYGSLIMQYGAADAGRTMAVTLRHAGDFLHHSIGGRKVRLLKIDVEGHEAAVIRGARDWLTAHPADFVLFEVSTGRPFWEREEVTILDELGYSFFGIPHTIFRPRYSPIDRNVAVNIDYIRDVLACREGVKAPGLFGRHPPVAAISA